MVRLPKPLESDAIAKALRQVEVNTGAVVAAVITPISDTYLGYILFDTFLFAGLINAALWLAHLVTNVERLLIIQMAFMVLVVLPFYRRWIVSLMPRVLRYHHAARSAVMAFHHVMSETPTNRHVILLYVSLAERYVHILHSRSLNDTVDKAVWRDIVTHFTKVLPTVGLPEATLQAIKNIEVVLNSEPSV